jgi:antitoxin (DNA-binding transcriptional repressor) of toxin-antitoxin stability system
MSRIGVTRLCSALSDVVNRVEYGRERVVPERQGKPVAALVSDGDLELIQELEDRLDDLDADRAERESAAEPRIPWERIKAELDPRPTASSSSPRPSRN